MWSIRALLILRACGILSLSISIKGAREGVQKPDIYTEPFVLCEFCKTPYAHGNVPQEPLITSALCIRLAGCAFDMRD
jgi:hypothetical protein